MAEHESSTEEVTNTFRELLKRASEFMDAGVNRYAELAEERAQRLQTVEKKLESQLGADDRLVKRVASKAASAMALQNDLKTLADRRSRQPKLEAGDWAVHGRVLDGTTGEPLAKLKVSVADKDHQYEERLGATKTDEHGDFAAVYHEKELHELLEKAPDLYLSVTDAKGKVLFRSREPMHRELGKAEYYSVWLAERPNTKPKKTTVQKKATRKKTTKRRPRSKGAGKSEE